jgi:hypothetical protein
MYDYNHRTNKNNNVNQCFYIIVMNKLRLIVVDLTVINKIEGGENENPLYPIGTFETACRLWGYKRSF